MLQLLWKIYPTHKCTHSRVFILINDESFDIDDIDDVSSPLVPKPQTPPTSITLTTLLGSSCWPTLSTNTTHIGHHWQFLSLANAILLNTHWGCWCRIAYWLATQSLHFTTNFAIPNISLTHSNTIFTLQDDSPSKLQPISFCRLCHLLCNKFISSLHVLTFQSLHITPIILSPSNIPLPPIHHKPNLI